MAESVPGGVGLVAQVPVAGRRGLLNNNASAFCLAPDGRGAQDSQFCSASCQRVGSSPLVVREHVTGTVALLSTGPSGAVEVFILTDPPPAP